MIENFDSQRELQDDSVKFDPNLWTFVFFFALAENIQQLHASAAH
jgi:hypothetical protein